MDINKILAAEVPSGKYRLGLLKLQTELIYLTNIAPECDQLIDSLCASFEALLELAEWEKVGFDIHNMPHTWYKAVGKKWRQFWRNNTLREVLKFVDEMATEMVEATEYKWGSENEAPRWDLDTVGEFKSRLAKLQEEGN